MLFSELDGYSVLENQRRQLKAAIASAPERLANRPDDEVVSEYVARYKLDVPTLLDSEMTMSEREIDVDVSRDPRRMFIERGRPFYLKGTEITVHIPFKGEADLFRVQPNFFSSSMPRGTIQGQELLIRFTFPNDSPPPDIKGELSRSVTEISQFLNKLREMATQLQNELGPLARQAWHQRKSQFSTRSQIVAGLGIPKRREVPVDGPESLTKTPVNSGGKSGARASRAPHKRATEWDAFISHASEDKDSFVKPLADALRSKGVRVWYDEYALTVGDSLRAKIDEGLAKSQFGIVVLSPAFFEKHWPQQELNGLAAKEVDGVKVILPVWHNVTRRDVAAQSPMLADRVATSSSRSLEKVVEELMRAMVLQ